MRAGGSVRGGRMRALRCAVRRGGVRAGSASRRGWLGRMAARALDVVLAPAARVAEDLPRRVEALHLIRITRYVGMEDLREGAVGSLDHERVRARVDLQHPVQVGSVRLHSGTMRGRSVDVQAPWVRSGGVRTARRASRWCRAGRAYLSLALFEPCSASVAWAAASRATGTRNGEHDT